ncbi:MAG TPA: DUF3667 domain-containing protein [Thermoanaerobaculia bacterium]
MDLPVTPTVCPNCNATFERNYCQDCGQKRIPSNLRLRDLALDAAHELFSLDGKLFRSLRLLAFRPGSLTQEFIKGRRTRYVSPIRLYLLCSLVFFALLAIPSNRDSVIHGYESARAEGTTATAHEDGTVDPNAEDRPHDAAARSAAALSLLPKAMFALMPLFAALVWLVCRRDEPYFLPHFYFSIHVHAFAFILFSLVILIDQIPHPAAYPVALLLLFGMPAYSLVAFRRLYRHGWFRTILKAALIGVPYLVILALTVELVLTLTRFL